MNENVPAISEADIRKFVLPLVGPRRLGAITLRDGTVGIMLDALPSEARALEPLRLQVEQAVQALPHVKQVFVVLTSDDAGAPPAAPASGKGTGLASVAKVVAVSSGKGGVGKSTVAVNLALALQAQGLRVGVLDADIYGPSVPKLLGLHGKPDSDGQMLKPMLAFGLKAMSIGLLVNPDTAMVWRGPMATSALNQLLVDVDWGELDILIVDMPPGTGDIQLSLAQRANLAGAIVVSTPQDLALLDARKGIAMFRKVDVPILGIVENMSSFVCPHCHTRADIFGHGGARAAAAELGMAFLGDVPLHMDIRTLSDAGTPIVAHAPDGPQAMSFHVMAAAVTQVLKIALKPLPVISMVG